MEWGLRPPLFLWYIDRMTESITYYRYVPHHQQKRWEDAGWEYHGELGPPHAAYSSLYVWPREGEPTIPENIDVTVAEKRRKVDSEDLCDTNNLGK